MVLNSSSTTTPVQETPNAAAAGSAESGNAFDAQAHVPGFGPWMRGGGGRGRFMRGGMNHPFFRPETVSLEGGEGHHRGHHHPHHHHHHPHPHHTPPPPPAESGALPDRDPPLASYSPRFPMGEFGGPGLANLMGHHARAFAGDLANHFGAPPPPGESFGPGSSSNPRDDFGGFGRFGGGFFRGGRGGGWGGRGGRGGFGGGFGGFGGGGWRGRFPPHGPPPFHHHPHRDFDLPRMDIHQADNTYTVTVELPGLQKQNVDISVNEGLLIISGEYTSSSGNPAPEDPFDEYDYMGMGDEAEEVEMEAPEYSSEQGNGHYIVHERPSGKFKRSIRLPSWVDVDSIKATMADGLLTVVFEKPFPQAPTPSVHKVSIA